LEIRHRSAGTIIAFNFIVVTNGIETPGFKAGEIRISAEAEYLSIEGKKEESTEKKSGKTVFSEKRSNQFCRSLRLSAEIDPAKVSATLKDGVLEIILPKAPAQQAVGVEVKVG
jgi:HSP20 family protein